MLLEVPHRRVGFQEQPRDAAEDRRLDEAVLGQRDARRAAAGSPGRTAEGLRSE